MLKNRYHSWIGHTIKHNKFVVNILKELYPEKGPWQYLKQVARNTGAEIYTTMKIMACNNSRWKAANQSKD
jgi:hypothetical protein